METKLYTLHAHPKADGLEIVGEPGWLAAVPPLWALYEGLWLTLAAQCAVLVLAALWVPIALGTVYLGMILITVLDGNSVHRLELRLRGWREVGCVVAGTEEGAEELYLSGAVQ